MLLPDEPGPDSLDPATGWLGESNAIQQALMSRSLTQYVRGEDGQALLVPDLATDLGTPNENFTEWTFTIRDDARWENGDLITAQEVALGICRTLDSGVFGARPATQYAKRYFRGARKYLGPYTGEDEQCAEWDGISIDGQDLTIEMSRPFAEMDHLGSIMALGPVPLGDAARPESYGQQILANGPYKVDSFVPGESLRLVRNEQWDPASDPGRHQYVDGWVFKFDQDGSEVDQLMLSEGEESRTSLATSLGADKFTQAKELLDERLVVQPTQCVSLLAPDYAKISDIRVRKALAYAYPYAQAWTASGQIPDVTRIPANSIMPPGMPGRVDYFVDDAQISHDPERARELLAEAGYTDKPFKITMIYYAVDPLGKAAQDAITHGFEEGGFEVNAIGVQENPYNIWLDPKSKVNRSLNVRGVNWCADWPSGSVMLPALLAPDSRYNVAGFDEETVSETMAEIVDLPREEQPAAWGALDEDVMGEFFPIIPTAFRSEVFAFGEKIGNPQGEESLGSPNYRDLYVVP